MKIKTVAVLAMIFFSLSCELLDKSDPRKLLLVNASSQDILFYRSVAYDSTYIDAQRHTNRVQMNVVQAWKSFEYSSRIPWESILESSVENKFVVFVVNADSVRRYAGIEPLYPQNRNRILKIWTLNLDSLKKFHWTLTFP